MFVSNRTAPLNNRPPASPSTAHPARARPLLVVGGPRFDEAMTAELGVDRIFGRGTTPAEVASYLVHAVLPATPA